MQAYGEYINCYYKSRKVIDRRKEKIRAMAIAQGKPPPSGKIIKKMLSQKKEHFEKRKDKFFMIDRFPENSERFPLSYADFLAYHSGISL
ncbi:hypothetical protein [Solidesulfovibrio magneticus]|uniref:hypothetical protein n=1 Tax=Solidesulfovibrio magneticus TaxID=184917 RepID=UPI0011D06A4C|nr:hypothetical protein [Solidesulfovibrio magneticus]